MRTSALIFVVLLAIALGGVALKGTAHSPALHGFKLVTFDKPFTAPVFQLPDLAGESRHLSDYRGQYVLLNFWATWCAPCLAEMPAMEQLYQHYRNRGFVVLAVSSDTEGRSIVQPFTEKLGVTFPVLLDPDTKISITYGARNLPISFLLDREGRVVAAVGGAREWFSEAALSVLDEIIVP